MKTLRNILAVLTIMMALPTTAQTFERFPAKREKRRKPKGQNQP